MFKMSNAGERATEIENVVENYFAPNETKNCF